MDKVVDFKSKKAAPVPANDGLDERAILMQTIENLLTMQGHQEQQISTLIVLIGEMQSRISDLEHNVTQLKKAAPKKPAILNAHGARAN